MTETFPLRFIVEHLEEHTPLSRRQSEVFALMWVCDRDEQATADELDIEVGSVRSHKGRIQQKLSEASALLEAYNLSERMQESEGDG